MKIIAKGTRETISFEQSSNSSYYELKAGARLTIYDADGSDIRIVATDDEGTVTVRIVQPLMREMPIKHEINIAPADSPPEAEPACPQSDPWLPAKPGPKSFRSRTGEVTGRVEPKVGEPLSGEWPVSPDYLQPDPWPAEVAGGASQIAQPSTRATRTAQEIERELFAGTRPSELPKADAGPSAHARATD